jgi:putative multiple sugar transport system substrate-binding protein
MKKLLLVLVVLFAVVTSTLFAGGGQNRQSGIPIIGVAMPEIHVLRWLKDGASLVETSTNHGYTVYANWANGDQLTQNNQIQSFLTQGANLLIIACINDGVASIVAEARRDGVPVIAYDRLIQNSADYDYYITFNNFKVGELQGQAIADALNLNAATASAPKTIALFAGSPTDGNSSYLFDGAMSILGPYIDRGVLRVVGPSPKNSTDRTNFQRITTEGWYGPIAKARMENILVNDARDIVLDAILVPNDTLAQSIIEACKADAKYRNRLPIVTGQDAEFNSMMLIKNGEQYMTVFKDTAKLAEAAVNLADQILKGLRPNMPGLTIAETVGLGAIGDTGRKRVTTYLLDPIPVTRNNNFLTPVNSGFFTDEEAAQLR